MTVSHPAIGRSIQAAGLDTNYHDLGEGRPLVLLHGSGVGVTGWENWRGMMPRLAETYRVVVPDIVGFGFTERPEGTEYSIKLWTRHLLGFLDALGLERPVLVGNSFGGALSLALAMRHRDRISGMVLMGTPAGDFTATSGSNAWYYEPSLEAMGTMLRAFPYDVSIVDDEMIASRHEVTQLAGGLEAYRKLFPAPGPEGETRTVHGIPVERLEAIETPILALHGREDKMVPPECGVRILQHCPNAQLHLFGKCGHWVQIERADEFLTQTRAFVDRLPE